jgi:hypothetical protein
MNKVIKKKWLKALRSKEYKQGYSQLRTKDNRYCCLGVLCDILPGNEWAREYLSNGVIYRSAIPGHKSMAIYLHDSLLEQLNLLVVEQSDLIQLNDAGYTFEEIANVIEEHL